MFMSLYVLGLPCYGNTLRDYHNTGGNINTAAPNHATALISSQVAAFHKHSNQTRLPFPTKSTAYSV